MTVLIEHAYELETIAPSAPAEGEIGAHFFKGHLRYPSETGGWQLGDLDLDEYVSPSVTQPSSAIASWS